MIKSGPVSVALLAAACGGQTQADRGTGGTPPATVTDGTGGVVAGAGGAGPRDADTDVGVTPPPVDALFPIDPVVPWDSGACIGTTAVPISGAAPCTYGIPVPDGVTLDLTKLNVLYLAGDQSRYLVLRSATCDSGWHLIEDQTRIEICGSACDLIRNDPGAEIELVFCGGGGPLIT
jgi:hypothetical protein